MIVKADRVIVGDGKSVLEGAAVCVQDGRIAAVGIPQELRSQFPLEDVIEFPGASLLPGLIDMHVHIGYFGERDDASEFEKNSDLAALFAVDSMKKTLEAGVTTVRDVSSARGIAQTLRRAEQKGLAVIPRIITCGQGICMTGGHGWTMTGAVCECDGEWEIRKAIRRQLRDGADWIKVLTSEAYRGQELTQPELDAAVDECHRMGCKVAVHAGYIPSVEMAIKAGFDTIEHGTYLTAEQAHEMREKGIAWTPTIVAFSYIRDVMRNAAGEQESGLDLGYIGEASDIYERNFKALYDTGVTVVTGTDQVLGGAPVSPVARECQYMVDYGITPLEAIACATRNCAEVLGMGDELGQVRENYLADLIAVDGDPSKDILALKNVRAVILKGELL